MKFLVDQSLGGLVKWLRGWPGSMRPTGKPSRRPKPPSLPAPVPETYLLTRREGLRRLNRDDLLVLEANARKNNWRRFCVSP